MIMAAFSEVSACQEPPQACKHARGQPYWSHFGVEETEAERLPSPAPGGTQHTVQQLRESDGHS